MKQYGIICCPTCHGIKIIEIGHNSTKCNRCGKTLILNKIKLLHKTTSIEEARYVVGMINADIAGDKEDFKNLYRK